MEAGGGLETTCTTLHGCTFEIPACYGNLTAVGKGSYGIVVSAVDRRTGEAVAIKKICPMSAHASDAKHALREIRLLSHMGRHENIVTLLDLFCREAADELYLVMELLDSDLHRIIRSSQVLTISHHRVFMLQLLRGVKFLHDNRIIHRDLKPGNILINRNCDLRITDFGLARAVPEGATAAEAEDGVNEHMTEHVVTRWYRPPELMLSPNGYYSFPVDMWSVGCILAELLGKQPLFPGRDFVDQLKLIFAVVGAPSGDDVLHIRGKEAQRFLRSMRGAKPTPLAELFPGTDRGALDLLASLLKFNPADRLNTTEALDHPFLEEFRDDPFEELPPLTALKFDFEKKGLPRSALRRLVLEEVAQFQEERGGRDRQTTSSSEHRRKSGPGAAGPAFSFPERGAAGGFGYGGSDDGGGGSTSVDSHNPAATDLECTPLSCSLTDSEKGGETCRGNGHGRAPGGFDGGAARYFADSSGANVASYNGGAACGHGGASKRKLYDKGLFGGVSDGRSFEESESELATSDAASTLRSGAALQAHGENGDSGGNGGGRGAKGAGADAEKHNGSGGSRREEVERERLRAAHDGSSATPAPIADVSGYLTSGTSTLCECLPAAGTGLPMLQVANGDRDVTALPLPPPPPAAAASQQHQQQQQQQRRPQLYWSRSGRSGSGGSAAAGPQAEPGLACQAATAVATGHVHTPSAALSLGHSKSDPLQRPEKQSALPPESPLPGTSITHFTRTGSMGSTSGAGSVGDVAGAGSFAQVSRPLRRQEPPTASALRCADNNLDSSSASSAASAQRRMSSSLSAAAKKLMPVSKHARITGAGIFRPSWRQRLPLPVRGVPLAGAAGAGIAEEGGGSKGNCGGCSNSGSSGDSMSGFEGGPRPPASMVRSNSGSTASASAIGGSGSFSSHLSCGGVSHGVVFEEDDPEAPAGAGRASAAASPSLGFIPAPPDAPYPMLRAGSSGRMAADRLLLRRGGGRSASEGNIDRALVAAALNSSPLMGRSCAFGLGSLGDSGGRPSLGQRPPFLCDILEDSSGGGDACGGSSGGGGGGGGSGGGGSNGSSRRLVAMKGPLPQLGVSTPMPPAPGPGLAPGQVPLRTARVYCRPLNTAGGAGQRPLQLQPMRPLHPQPGTMATDGSTAGTTGSDSQDLQQRKPPPPPGLRRSGRSRSINDGLRDLGKVAAGVGGEDIEHTRRLYREY